MPANRAGADGRTPAPAVDTSDRVQSTTCAPPGDQKRSTDGRPRIRTPYRVARNFIYVDEDLWDALNRAFPRKYTIPLIFIDFLRHYDSICCGNGVYNSRGITYTLSDCRVGCGEQAFEKGMEALVSAGFIERKDRPIGNGAYLYRASSAWQNTTTNPETVAKLDRRAKRLEEKTDRKRGGKKRSPRNSTPEKQGTEPQPTPEKQGTESVSPDPGKAGYHFPISTPEKHAEKESLKEEYLLGGIPQDTAGRNQNMQNKNQEAPSALPESSTTPPQAPARTNPETVQLDPPDPQPPHGKEWPPHVQQFLDATDHNRTDRFLLAKAAILSVGDEPLHGTVAEVAGYLRDAAPVAGRRELLARTLRVAGRNPNVFYIALKDAAAMAKGETP